MKKYLMILFLALGSMSFANQGWSPVSKEQTEYNAIQMKIAQIKEQCTAMGASSSSPACKGAIFQLLKGIGSPVSYAILKELVASGYLDGSYLNQA